MEYSLPVLMLYTQQPDLNCGDISDRRFAVLPRHDNDGIGCEIGGEPTGGLLQVI
jgi:hypothetical protein